MSATIEVINPLDTAAVWRWHRECEADVGETPVEIMTDAELIAVVLHDPDLPTRRKALNIIRLREYKAGSQMAVDCLAKVAK
jgi:hypothetical protein